MENDKKISVVSVPVANSADRSGYYALGVLVAYAKAYAGGRLTCKMDFRPIRPFSEKEAGDFLSGLDFSRPAVYLFSVFVWNESQSLSMAEKIRRKSPQSLIVFGGANIPRNAGEAKKYLSKNSVIDTIVLGEGEETLAELLDSVCRDINSQKNPRRADFSSIFGVAYRKNFDVFVNAPRPLIKNIDEIPSPYLSEVFDKEIIKNFFTVYTETTRGCPFGCTFCDWGGQTLSKVRKYDVERIKNEMHWFFSRGIKNIMLNDANFGMLERDVALTDWIVDCKARTGWPKSFIANMAKNSARRVAEISVKLYRANLTEDRLAIAIQTFDENTLLNIERSNIKTRDYEEIIRIFRENGMQMYTELLIGLPGQTLETFSRDLQNSFDLMILAAVYPVKIMTNAPMGDPDYQRKFKIKVNEDLYPISTYSYSEECFHEMIWIKMIYSLFIHQNMMKYILIYFQVEKKVDAISIFYNFVKKIDFYRDSYPNLMWSVIFSRDKVFQKNKDWLLLHWNHDDGVMLHEKIDSIYEEFFDFMEKNHGAFSSDMEKKSLISLQKSAFVHMNKKSPEAIPVDLDVIAYFRQFVPEISLRNLGARISPLGSFGPGEILIPKQHVRLRMGFLQQDLRACEWPFRISGIEVL